MTEFTGATRFSWRPLLFCYSGLLGSTPTERSSPPWSDYTQEDGLASNNVLAVTVGVGEVWFGTDHGISRYNGAWHSWTEGADLQGGVHTLTFGESNSELWAGTATGAVLVWNGSAWDLLTRLQSPVKALHYTRGQLWIGTTSGLYIWNGEAPSPVTGLNEANISVIGSSNGGDSIWVGTSDWSVAQAGRPLARDWGSRRSACPGNHRTVG